MSLFFCGIGGIGMSALARWCQKEGSMVLGSDENRSDITHQLEKEGITFFSPQNSTNLPDTTEVFIYSEAVASDHPERLRAQELGIPQYSYFEYLGKMTQEKRLIAVAGTHGKTTTTGLIASGMMGAGFDPTVVIGAQTPLFKNANFHAGTSDWCVVEACEYRENFRFLHPEIVVLTNLELDHLDYYKNEEDYLRAFQSFIQKAKIIICHKEDAQVQKLLKGFSGNVFFTSPNRFNLQLIGDHNQSNAQLAVALGNVLGAKENSFQKGVEQFAGTARRQEFLGEKNGIKIYDDYGHHPTEIKVTYNAFKEAFPNKKIGLIFQPHQYSRTHVLLSEFKEVLLPINDLGILSIYEARDTDEDRAKISSDSFAEECSGDLLSNKDSIDLFVKKNFSSGDILVFMGAGNVSQMARDWMGYRVS